MEKYYVSQLDELNQRHSINKLVEVGFSRRPSTFGVLYVSESAASNETGANGPAGVWLRLATLSLTSDNKAKFMTVRGIQLDNLRYESPHFGQQQQTQATKHQLPKRGRFIADFDTLPSGQLLIEGASSNNASQTLQSSVFLLTCNGQLLVVSMIDRNSRRLSISADRQERSQVNLPPGRQSIERFLQIKTVRHHEQTAATGKGLAPANTTSPLARLDLLVLSTTCLYSYAAALNQLANFSDCNLQLRYKYSLDQNALVFNTNSHFTQMLPLASRFDETNLLQLNDGSVHIVRQAQRLAHLPNLCLDVSQSLLFSSPSDEPNVLISLTRTNQLVANSLIISQSHVKSQQQEGTTKRQEDDEVDTNEVATFGLSSISTSATDDDRDPDKLLLEEPNFELERCWSLDLNEFPGIRPMFDEDDDDDHDSVEGDNSDQQRPSQASSLCLPIWSPAPNTNNEPQLLSDGRPNSWPRSLIIFCKQHVLMFSFEHANVLPFSLVYDRAFLNLTTPVSDSSLAEETATKQQVKSQLQDQLQDKRLDLRLRPKLLHNIKLIGTRASDSLLNMLFLTTRIHLVQASNFNHLALLAAISNQGHVLVFKMTSKKLLGPNPKDNLYQQLLIDSLRDSALLQEEIQRMRTLELSLKDKIGRLEAQMNRISQQDDIEEAATETGNQKVERNMLKLGFALEPSEQFGQNGGNLYELTISWPSVVLTVSRVIVVSAVEGSQLRAPSKDHGVDNTNFSSPINKAKVRRVFIENSESQNELDRLFQDCSGELESCPQMAAAGRALIELVEEEPLGLDQDLTNLEISLDNFSQQTKLSVPLTLEEFKIGIVKVYLICSTPLVDQSQQQLNLFAHQNLIVPQSNHLASRSEHKFVKREMSVKALSSFRFVPNEKSTQSIQTISDLNKFSFSGPFGQEKALVWLEKLLDLPSPEIANYSSEKIVLEFKSISRDSKILFEIAKNSLSFTGDDAKVLEMIKRHTLKEATNDSIQLTPGTSKSS